MVRVIAGKIKAYEPRGYMPVLAVGFGKLRMDDPSPMSYSKCTVRPDSNEEIVLEIR